MDKRLEKIKNEVENKSPNINYCVSEISNISPNKVKGEAFNLLLENCDIPTLVDEIANQYNGKFNEIVDLIENSKLNSIITKKVKVIGMYYPKLTNGGIERVMEHLTKLYISMGYRVVLITDTPSKEDYIEIPRNAKRYDIRRTNSYIERAEQISKIVKKEKIDTMIYHSWCNHLMAIEMMLYKALDVSFVIHTHGIFTFPLMNHNPYFGYMPKVYSVADAILTLDQVDADYWRNFNAKIFTVLNPTTIDIKSSEQSKLTDNIILWVARISPEKKPEEALFVLSEVCKELSNVKLKMVGKPNTDQSLQSLQNLALKLGVENNVEFSGFHEDVSKFYLESSVVLSTSFIEGFSLVFLESKTFGVPIVLYELPYLTLCEDNRGMFPVRYGDHKAAAKEIIDLLLDREKLKGAALEGRKHALELSEYDYKGTWRNIFNSLSNYRDSVELSKSQIQMWKTLMYDYTFPNLERQNSTKYKNIQKITQKQDFRTKNKQEVVLQTKQEVKNSALTKFYIVFICDEENVKSLSVALVSILENSYSSKNIDVTVLCKTDYTIENTEKISFIKDKYNCDIKFVVTDNINKDNCQEIAKTVSKNLNKVDKCIYLDYNVVVQKDLTNLINFELNDFVIGGVIDAEFNTISSSVLLIDCCKIRELDIYEIKEIDLKFNLRADYFKNEPSFDFGKKAFIAQELIDKFDKKQLREAFRENVIFSYSDEKNPLNDSEVSFVDVWNKYFEISTFNIIENTKENCNIIPVALASDENYAMPLSVTLTSMLKNSSPTTFYDIYVLTDKSFSKDTQNIILSLEKMYNNCTISFIYLNDEFENVKINKNQHFTKETYFRLLLSSYLQNLDKCIYLDCDIIVQKDLFELFSTDIDNYYVAGVKAFGVTVNWGQKYAESIGIPTIEQYINAGVLLLNLNSIRSNQIEKKFIELSSKRNFLLVDQDIINVICFDKIKQINLKFNLPTNSFHIENGKINSNNLSKCFPTNIIEDAIENNIILHYLSEVKPWNDKNCNCSDIWWKYYYLSPFENKENSNIIPITLASDENYAMPLSVTITSLLENASLTTFYDIYVLTDESFSKATQNTILSLNEKYTNCKINFIYVGDEFDDVKLSEKQHFTKATFYRLSLPSILDNIDKCIYLDCDIIVQKDLFEFFSTDIEDYYLAGVKDSYIISCLGKQYSHNIGIPSINQYINSGVLLMNLNKIRADNIGSKLLELSTKRKFNFVDQDIYNIVCYNKIKHIDLKYNLHPNSFEIDLINKKINPKYLPNCFNKNEIIDAINDSTIIHYVDVNKPWKNQHSNLAEIWTKYFALSPYFKIEFDDLKNVLDDSKKFVKRLDDYSKDEVKEKYNIIEEVVSKISKSVITDELAQIRQEFIVILDRLLNYVIDKVNLAHIKPNINVYTPESLLVFEWENSTTWSNNELMKGFNLIGYTLADAIKATPHIFLCPPDLDYPYAKQLPKLKFEYRKTEKHEEFINNYKEFLLQNYEKMDILVINGIYDFGIYLLDEYRKLRPDGKVYCALDMNSGWMQRIPWESPKIQNFANQCDVISTVCTHVRDLLNGNPKVNFTCRFFSNAFYNPNQIPANIDISKKENTILTVSRIGTYQKNNQEMLMGFAKIADKLPDWKLKLVGNIDDEFKPFMDKYFNEYPHLKEQVIFTGPIIDKQELYNEYARAKIFMLTSVYEGGAPNVYAEALYHGCKFFTSDIDAADDIINRGELGVKYKRGDIDELATKLFDLCSNFDNEKIEEHIEKSTVYYQSYYDWNRNAKKLAYILLNSTLEE